MRLVRAAHFSSKSSCLSYVVSVTSLCSNNLVYLVAGQRSSLDQGVGDRLDESTVGQEDLASLSSGRSQQGLGLFLASSYCPSENLGQLHIRAGDVMSIAQPRLPRTHNPFCNCSCQVSDDVGTGSRLNPGSRSATRQQVQQRLHHLRLLVFSDLAGVILAGDHGY